MVVKLWVQGNLKCFCECTIWISGEVKAARVIGKEAMSLSFGSVCLCLPDLCFWLWAKSLLVNPLCQFMLTSARTAACQPANRALLQGAGLWTLSCFRCFHWSITKASFSLRPPACCLPGTCPICQFVGLLSFIQQCGANRACHPLRIKMYICTDVLASVTFFFKAHLVSGRDLVFPAPFWYQISHCCGWCLWKGSTLLSYDLLNTMEPCVEEFGLL